MEKPTGSWLCPTEADRARMLEAGALVRLTRVWVSLLVAAATAAAGPWLGWWPSLFGVLAAVLPAVRAVRLNVLAAIATE